MQRVEWHDEELVLLPERCAWWPRQRALLLADPHFGKGAAFRQAGVAVPAGSTEADLARLTAALEATEPETLYILGDFFHHRGSRAPGVLEQLGAWRSECSGLEIVLIRGNHDQHAGDPPAELGIRTVAEPFTVEPFILLHEPASAPDRPALAGHLHPAIRLGGAGRERLTLPCFWLGERQLVLPAFGSFTGNALIQPAARDHVYAVGEDGVCPVKLPSRPPGARRSIT